MGNTSTKEKTDSVDGGALLPHGIYTGPQDYDFRIVQRLILQRKLGPFYKGLEDWDDSEDAQEEKKNQQRITTNSNSNNDSGNSNNKSFSHSRTHSQSNHNSARGGNSSNSNYNNYSNADRHLSDLEREKKRLYQGAIECPICFLYYPRNINRTRCCDKPMCTECFVQLKRLESAPTESPACPYCVEPHFGVIYSPALVPPGFLSSTAPGGAPMTASSSSNSMEQNPSSPSTRRRSTSHKSPEVVTADELRPDWNRRILAAAHNQAASRRASTNSSVSNATFALGRRLAAGRHAGSNSRRSNSSAAAADYSGYLTAMRNMGADLEELMIMEAMRQSLQDEHDRQTREAATTTATTPSTTATATTLTDTTQHQLTQSSGSRIEDRAAGGSSSEGLVVTATPHTSSGHSSNSPLSSTTVHGTMSIEQEDDAVSLTSGSDDGPGSESDSDQEMDNHAIRYANVAIPASTPMERARKHQEGPTSATTPAPAPASSEAM